MNKGEKEKLKNISNVVESKVNSTIKKRELDNLKHNFKRPLLVFFLI